MTKEKIYWIFVTFAETKQWFECTRELMVVITFEFSINFSQFARISAISVCVAMVCDNFGVDFKYQFATFSVFFGSFKNCQDNKYVR